MALTKITSRILDSSGVTTVGTISTGVWQGTAIASAYLDADTAHLSTTQTFTGAKTFSSNLITTGDVTFTGASYNAVWDTSANLLQFADNAVIRVGTGNDVDIYHSSNVTYIKTQTDLPVSFIDAGGADMLKLTPNGAVNLYHNGTLALSTAANGNVGIGNSSPNSYFVRGGGLVVDAADAGSNVVILNDNNTYSSLFFAKGSTGAEKYQGYVEYEHANNIMTFGTAQGERMRILADGKVGIGTTSPSELLTLGGTANVQLTLKSNDTTDGMSEIYFGDSDATYRGAISYDHDGDHMSLHTAGASRLTILSDGKVGIGDTSPEELLEIKSSSAPAIQLNQGDSYKGIIRLGGNDLEIRGSSGAMEFYNGSADGDSSSLRLVIESDGAIRAKTGSFVVDTAGQGIYLGGTSSANKLDDYEEGTWTPTIVYGTSLVNVNSRYTVIGNICHFNLYIYNQSIPNNSNVYAISVPFSPDATAGDYVACNISYSGSFNTNSWLPIVHQTAQYIYFHVNNGSSSVLTNANVQGINEIILSGWYYI